MNVKLTDIYNPYTLNIFSDASFNGKRSAYGIVCVCGDKIIYKFDGLCGNNNIVIAEGRGIRRALDIAFNYINKYQYINIFSDSQLSVYSIRGDYLKRWRFDSKINKYKNASNNIAKNQELIIEAYKMFNILSSRGNISIYHQKSHVNNRYTDIIHAAKVFKDSNYINGKIDLNYIRYISTWNNYVDRMAVSKLAHDNLKWDFEDPLEFDLSSKQNRI